MISGGQVRSTGSAFTPSIVNGKPAHRTEIEPRDIDTEAHTWPIGIHGIVEKAAHLGLPVIDGERVGERFHLQHVEHCLHEPAAHLVDLVLPDVSISSTT